MSHQATLTLPRNQWGGGMGAYPRIFLEIRFDLVASGEGSGGKCVNPPSLFLGV